jgi:hypothetical protein
LASPAERLPERSASAIPNGRTALPDEFEPAYHPYPNGALSDPTFDDLPALAQAAAASRAAQAASAVQAARVAEAEAEARAVVEDHAAVQAAYREAVADEAVAPADHGSPPGAVHRPPADFRPPQQTSFQQTQPPPPLPQQARPQQAPLPPAAPHQVGPQPTALNPAAPELAPPELAPPQRVAPHQAVPHQAAPYQATQPRVALPHVPPHQALAEPHPGPAGPGQDGRRPATGGLGDPAGGPRPVAPAGPGPLNPSPVIQPPPTHTPPATSTATPTHIPATTPPELRSPGQHLTGFRTAPTAPTDFRRPADPVPAPPTDFRLSTNGTGGFRPSAHAPEESRPGTPGGEPRTGSGGAERPSPTRVREPQAEFGGSPPTEPRDSTLGAAEPREPGRTSGEPARPDPFRASRGYYPAAPTGLPPLVPSPPVTLPAVPPLPESANPPPLPQRVPAPPDVPSVPDGDLEEPENPFIQSGERPRPPLAGPELARIATGLRYNEEFDQESPPDQRPDGFDWDAVLIAVRKVDGVREAQLRPNPGGVHTLRLDLADGADGAQVSREVARLLKERMGLAAEPRRQPGAPTVARGTAAPVRESAGHPVAGTTPGSGPQPLPTVTELPGTGHASPGLDDRARQRHPVTPVRGRGTGESDGEVRRQVRPGAAPRVVIDQVRVSTLGLDATVEVRLNNNGSPAVGVASGPAVDGYVLRLAAVAATSAIDQLLGTVDTVEQSGRSFVEHAAVVPFGSCEVAVVVVLLVFGGTVEQLAGSALVAGDPRQAVVRATLAAVNRRLDALL